MNSRYNVEIALTAMLLAASPRASGGPAHEPARDACASAPSVGGSSKQRFESTSLMLVVNELEAQGEAYFHLKYADPKAECVIEVFERSDAKVTATYNAFEKGPSTLNYRFAIDRPGGETNVLVLYSGTASLVGGGGYLFHVSEEKNGVIAWYAMFRDPPAYPIVKVLVERILDGTAKPLLAVRWPKGAKEAEVMAFDAKRLKK